MRLRGAKNLEIFKSDLPFLGKILLLLCLKCLLQGGTDLPMASQILLNSHSQISPHGKIRNNSAPAIKFVISPRGFSFINKNESWRIVSFNFFQ